MQLNYLSSKIIKDAISVHKELGPGLLETVYQLCMIIKLKSMGLKIQSEVSLPIYKGKTLCASVCSVRGDNFLRAVTHR